jgi:hypothetical protein
MTIKHLTCPTVNCWTLIIDLLHMDYKSLHIRSSSRNVLEYLPNDSIILDLPFILTDSKKLTKNMPYMLLEGKHTTAVRLLTVHDNNGMVYLNVQELVTNKTYTLSWNMEYTGDYWLWSLADLSTLLKQK